MILSLSLRSFAVGLVVLSAAVGATSCGDTRDRVATTAGTATAHRDRDNDEDHNDDDERALDFGHPASPVERRAITGLIVDYYAAAVKSDGARACTLLAPQLRETLVIQNGESKSLYGRSCAVVLSKLFTLHHRELTEKEAALKVVGVRVSGGRAIGVLNFPEIPETRQFGVRVAGGRWHAFSVMDGRIE